MKPLTFANLSQQDHEFCGKVPLHQTNLLQPHAYLLIADIETLSIIQAGENLEELTGAPVQEMTGTSLGNYFEEASLQKIKGQPGQESLPYFFSFQGQKHLAAVKKSGHLLFIEIEKETYHTSNHSFRDVYSDFRHITSKTDAADDTTSLCRIVASELKRISGYDKVMIYRFDKDWNGDVIAESMEPGMDSYLGLKFPASDIPKQARELYKATPFRVIPAVEYKPVKLFPLLNPQNQTFTDLSGCNLRSVAEVHLEYLKNMQVQSSMSTRILVNGELWGLIACHHRKPFYPGYEICSQFELLSMLISGRISSMQQQDILKNKSATQLLLTRYIENLYSSGDLAQTLDSSGGLVLGLLSAKGAALCIRNKVYSTGDTPPAHLIEEIIYWLRARNVNDLYVNTAMAAELDQLKDYSSVVSGMIALPIQPEQYVFMLGFRPEAAEEVTWAGNPYESVRLESNGKKYHPRASFSHWKETVRFSSRNWNIHEMETAENFRKAMIEFYFKSLSAAN